MSTAPASASLRFGRFELQPHERRLLADGQEAALGARAFDVLLALAQRPGRLVSKRDLMDLVWPDVVVEENNLAAQVSALRKVVGNECIATIPGRGYRFVAPVAAQPAAIDVATLPATPSPAALRTRLPADLPAMIGRDEDLAALGTLVDGHRLVTLVGAGGIGKSLLAQHLLQMRRDAYAQGVCWVSLAEIDDAALLPAAIATGLVLQGGPGAPLPQLLTALAPLEVLLALDNAEHLVDGVAQLAAVLLGRAPRVRLVVTSQAPLKLAAERVFRVGPLGVPDQALPAAQAHRYGAVALFVERVAALDRRFVLDDANAAPVIALCRELDGLPLAIELAAARVPLLGVAPLAAALHERLGLLSANRNRDAPARQQTLRAALEWSHGLLAAREQRVFRRLGVIAGSASLEVLRQLLVDAELDAWALLDALDTLVERSLVAVLDAERAGEAAATAPRYRLLESPSAYALERLDAAGERAELQRRHALALATLLDAAYDEYFHGGIGVAEWLQRLTPDLDNARDAFAWAAAAGETELQLRIGTVLMRALPPSQQAELLVLADACEAALIAAPGRVPAVLRKRTWLELSFVWADTQKLRSHAAAERSLALAESCASADAAFTRYLALARTASAAAQTGNVAAARALLPEIAALEDPRWPPQRLIWGTIAAQAVARMAGDADEALRLSRRLVALDRARGGDAAVALGNLIDHELAAGNAAAAVQAGQTLTAELGRTRHVYSLGFARLNLCAACLALGDLSQARAVGAAAWPAALAFELQHAAAAYLALLAALEGRPRAAARLLGYAEAIYTARNEAREANEAAAIERARQLGREALGMQAFERLHADGAALPDAEVAALAFAAADS